MINTLYKTTNLINNRIYIGVHETHDVGFGTETWVDPYVGSGVAIEKALKKYGRLNFLVEIIAYFDDKKDAYLAEADIVTKKWIRYMGRKTYNRTPGGSNPPNLIGTLWINDGINSARISASRKIPEGWKLGRIVFFSEEELKRRREYLIQRNITNNPMSNTQALMKMTNTLREGYANGTFTIHNKGKKKNATTN